MQEKANCKKMNIAEVICQYFEQIYERWGSLTPPTYLKVKPLFFFFF